MTGVLVHGLVVEAGSPVAPGRDPSPAVPDLLVTAGACREVPWTLPEGEVVALVGTPDQVVHAVVRTPGGYLVRLGGAADVEIDSGLRRATTHCDPTFDPAVLEVLVAGFLLATLLQLRGHLVLHASAVEVAGSAYAVVGPSGRGKSTVATLLCAGGARLVTDDVLRVDAGALGLPRARLGATATRLREASAGLAGGGGRLTADGRTSASPPLSTTDHLPLAGLLLPLPDRGTEDVVLEPVTGAAALVSLLSAPRVLGWREPTSLGLQLQQLGHLVDRVPVHTLRVPWGPPFAEDLGHRLLGAVAPLGAQPAGVSS